MIRAPAKMLAHGDRAPTVHVGSDVFVPTVPWAPIITVAVVGVFILGLIVYGQVVQ
jgi:hypothetical protein